MSTDRELLEAAARAAGMATPKWNEVHGYMMVGLGGETRQWDPLTDDGDALRLAVKLGMQVYVDNHPEGLACSEAHSVTLDAAMNQRAIVDHGTDPYAATRRAIVRAAAALADKQ